jgi:hypothetical protein
MYVTARLKPRPFKATPFSPPSMQIFFAPFKQVFSALHTNLLRPSKQIFFARFQSKPFS